jgi:hypothetical protein
MLAAVHIRLAAIHIRLAAIHACLPAIHAWLPANRIRVGPPLGFRAALLPHAGIPGKTAARPDSQSTWPGRSKPFRNG